MSDSATPWITACQVSLSITNSWSLFKLMSIESVIPFNHLIFCHPLLPLPSIFPRIRSFTNESALCIRWPKYCSFSFSISPSNEHPGLISFRMNWLDLVVQGTLRSLQHHSSKASILQCSALFIVQLSHPYITTRKAIALTRWTFVDKVMSLLFNMLSRLVITFLPWSKHLLISWLQSPSAVILDPKKIKSDTVSPSICHEVMEPNAMIFIFWMLSFKPTFSLSVPGSSVVKKKKKKFHLQYRRPQFDSWVRNIHWRRDRLFTPVFLGSPCDSAGKESACNAGDLCSVPGLWIFPRDEKGYPLQYPGLENSMDCIVHGVAKSWTQPSNFQSLDVKKLLSLIRSHLLIIVFISITPEDGSRKVSCNLYQCPAYVLF